MKKRGMLLAEQVVKIVIALIGLSFLIYLLSSLYFNKIGLENQIKADNFTKGSHDSLKLAIENLGEEPKEFFNPNVPNGWYLFSFTGEEKPTSCERKNCLCVCDSVLIYGQIDECNENGVCLIVNNLKDYDPELEIQLYVHPPTSLIIKNINDKIDVSKK